jgi:hypothetical protein
MHFEPRTWVKHIRTITQSCYSDIEVNDHKDLQKQNNNNKRRREEWGMNNNEKKEVKIHRKKLK